MSYNSIRNEFSVTVENTTNQTLRRVRVEVDLSDGSSNAITAKLGPTTRTDLAADEKLNIALSAKG